MRERWQFNPITFVPICRSLAVRATKSAKACDKASMYFHSGCLIRSDVISAAVRQRIPEKVLRAH